MLRYDSLACQEYNYSPWDLICLDVPKKPKWLQRGMLNIFLKWSTYIVCNHFFAGGLSRLPNFQKGGLTGSRVLEGGSWKRKGDFFLGGWGDGY